jgi:tRNA-specific 2-thiouridylase
MIRERQKKVVIAMSGGVDSSVAAALLVNQGYDVEGVSLRMWEENEGPRVCSDHRGAGEIARLLGIPHTRLDLRAPFVEAVVKPFAQDYLRGRTPNPCVACNRDFKLGTLLDWAKKQRADYVATGHYARIGAATSRRHFSLYRGADPAKDQSYFLFTLSQAQLEHTLFPLGEMHKSDVRKIATRLGMPVADRPESQDICFGDYRALVESYAGEKEIGGGDIVDRAGQVLGRHGGIHSVTVGQRRGLKIAAAHPLYVVDIERDSKRVVVGNKAELDCRGLIARNVNWIEPPSETNFAAEVQIRSRSRAIRCAIQLTAERDCAVRFEQCVSAVTAGQAAVFYRDDQVLGGGWIERAIRA